MCITITIIINKINEQISTFLYIYIHIYIYILAGWGVCGQDSTSKKKYGPNKKYDFWVKIESV